MRFSIISPVAGLSKFASLSTTHLLLCHVENPVYWKYYRSLSEDPNQLVILDNSSYEGKMNVDLALQCLQHLKPTCLVLPDFLGQRSDLTFAASIDFIRRWRHQMPVDFMYVPQFDGTIQDFQVMKKHLRHMVEDFGIKWFGLPRIIAERGYSRSELCLYLKRMAADWQDEQPYVHALGMCGGSLRELRELESAQCDSIDSSAPVWRGWNGYSLGSDSNWNLKGTPCDFDVHPNSLTSENEELIYENLRKVGVKC